MTEPISGRQCGGCTMCCTVTAVPELKKPLWQPCPHADHGCLIYDTRPPSCRSFECAWLRNPNLSERLRPDRCGVMVEVLPVPGVMLAMLDPNRPGMWKTPIVQDWLRELVRAGIAVIVMHPYGKPEVLALTVEQAKIALNNARVYAMQYAAKCQVEAG